MPCFTDDSPAYSFDKPLEIMLYRACRFLNKNQMEGIWSENRMKDHIYGNLLEWYSKHVIDDYWQAVERKNQSLINENKLRLAYLGIFMKDEK